MRVRDTVWIAPAGAFLLGMAALMVATGGGAWPFALGWTALAAVCAWLERSARTKRTRVFVPVMAVLALPVLVFEGGFFVLPAAVVLLAAAAIAPDPQQAVPGR